MPITKSIERKSTLTRLTFDMQSGIGKATLRHEISGQNPYEQDYSVDGAKFVELLSTPGQANVTLADQVTNAVYQYLVTSGLVEGAIS